MLISKYIKIYTYLIASIILGLIFFISGSGKLIGIEGTPAQIIDFTFSILPDSILVPGVLFFLFNVLVPYIFPIAEFLFGIFLLIGFVPRLIALLSILLTILFMSTNIWAIFIGGYSTCASCFGVWERIFGHLTPLQSLTIDIVMVILGILIITLHEGTFLSSRKRMANFIQNDLIPLCAKLKLFWSCRIGDKYIKDLTGAGKGVRYFITKHGQLSIVVAIILVCIIGAILYFGISYLATAEERELQDIARSISNITISDIKDKSARISITTTRPLLIDVIVKENNAMIGTWSNDVPSMSYQFLLEGLKPSTEYNLDLQAGFTEGRKRVLPFIRNSFTTAPEIVDLEPPVISNIRIIIDSPTSVIISWNTDKPSKYKIDYWLLNSNELLTVSGDELKNSHQVKLESLSPSEVYSCNITAISSKGNSGKYKRDFVFSTSSGVTLGKKAVDFTLKTLEGEPVSLSQFMGKTVVLNFWMATCGACRHEIPMIYQASNILPKDKIVFLNIHVGLRESIVKSFLISEKLQLIVLMDIDKVVKNLYEVHSFPTSFIIDSNGFIQSVDPNFNTTEDLIELIKNYID